MHLLVLITKNQIDLNSISIKWNVLGKVGFTESSRLVCETLDAWWAISLTPLIISDFEEEELYYVKARIDEPFFASFEFSPYDIPPSVLLKVINAITLLDDDLVDDDHGSIWLIGDFKNYISGLKDGDSVISKN